jgi:hypothetical protein
VDELVKKVEAAHDKYRNSGLALMTTVVSLSSAGIYSAKTVFGVDKLTTEFLLISDLLLPTASKEVMRVMLVY